MNSTSSLASLLLAALVSASALAQTEKAAPANPEYQIAADKLIRAASETDFAYQRLATLCDTFGPRFSGTTNLEAAIDWALAKMKADGLENVHGEEVMVPH